MFHSIYNLSQSIFSLSWYHNFRIWKNLHLFYQWNSNNILNNELFYVFVLHASTLSASCCCCLYCSQSSLMSVGIFLYLKCWLPFEKLLQCNRRSWDSSWATKHWSPTLWVNVVKSVWQICRMVEHFSIDLSSSTTTDKQTYHGNHDKHFLPFAHKFLSDLFSYEDFVVTGQTNKEIRSICHCFASLSLETVSSYQFPL